MDPLLLKRKSLTTIFKFLYRNPKIKFTYNKYIMFLNSKKINIMFLYIYMFLVLLSVMLKIENVLIIEHLTNM